MYIKPVPITKGPITAPKLAKNSTNPKYFVCSFADKFDFDITVNAFENNAESAIPCIARNTIANIGNFNDIPDKYNAVLHNAIEYRKVLLSPFCSNIFPQYDPNNIDTNGVIPIKVLANNVDPNISANCGKDDAIPTCTKTCKNGNANINFKLLFFNNIPPVFILYSHYTLYYLY